MAGRSKKTAKKSTTGGGGTTSASSSKTPSPPRTADLAAGIRRCYFEHTTAYSNETGILDAIEEAITHPSNPLGIPTDWAYKACHTAALTSWLEWRRQLLRTKQWLPSANPHNSVAQRAVMAKTLREDREKFEKTHAYSVHGLPLMSETVVAVLLANALGLNKEIDEYGMIEGDLTEVREMEMGVVWVYEEVWEFLESEKEEESEDEGVEVYEDADVDADEEMGEEDDVEVSENADADENSEADEEVSEDAEAHEEDEDEYMDEDDSESGDSNKENKEPEFPFVRRSSTGIIAGFLLH
jgi:hypothetical protein